jgi:aldehyde dehydrogenase (NAD+)
MSEREQLGRVLRELSLQLPQAEDHLAFLEPHSPVDGLPTFRLPVDDAAGLTNKVGRATESFFELRLVPAPLRGECVRRFALLLRKHKETLATLVTWESGKVYQEALGEVQEMIDICDFAVGLSRQLTGLTIASERPGHRMMEQWHPLGPVGVISAFNFPVAVWAWNAALAIVCGDPVVWKPSPQTPLCALACHELLLRAAADLGPAFAAVSQLSLGGAELGEQLASDARIPLLSATGSTRMGRSVAVRVAQRLGRSLLELGGNNAMIVSPSADLALALRAIVFSAVGTAGQRCTSLRRLIVHTSRLSELSQALMNAYSSLIIGNPFDAGTHLGPLVSDAAAEDFARTLKQAEAEGGQLLWGGRRLTSTPRAYVEPALVLMKEQTPVMLMECFAPLLYVLPYDDLSEALALHNAVPQGLSSAIFTENLREAELFLSPSGSDCGLANVNIGTSGAEVGGAFGGEKDTGGGRESGSDAWKNYMRRATNTVNYSGALPLAQGITFPATST